MPPTELVDDLSISDDEILWRRVSPDQIKRNHPVPGEHSPSSAAFLTSQMSVHRASLTTSRVVMAQYPKHSLAAFTAGVARKAGCIIVFQPTTEDPSHTLVCRGTDDPTQRLSGGQAKTIQKKFEWVVLNLPPL